MQMHSHLMGMPNFRGCVVRLEVLVLQWKACHVREFPAESFRDL